MDAVDIGKSITSLVSSATITIVLVFGNFLLRSKSKYATVEGITLSARNIHFILGPVLVLLNAALFVYLCALYKSNASHDQIDTLQHLPGHWILNPIFNPFYVSHNRIVNAIGYAFLIVLWWLGMYSFYYSIQLNPSVDGPWLFGWQTLISVLYLALGLGSMLAIQACWSKFGFAPYTTKLYASFLGIAVGCSVPPLLLHHGLPFLHALPFFR